MVCHIEGCLGCLLGGLKSAEGADEAAAESMSQSEDGRVTTYGWVAYSACSGVGCDGDDWYSNLTPRVAL